MVEMVEATLNNRFKIILPKHRADRPEWYTESGWEKKRLDHMYDNIQPGEYVFYVGAEEGEMCAILALKDIKVIMFEPNERVLPNIKATWLANNLEDVYFYKGFASDKTTGVLLTKISEIDGEVIPDHAFEELSEPKDIPQIKIDDMSNIPNVVSIDVEGSEWLVLKGAEETLRHHKPRIYLSLHPEFMRNVYNQNSDDLREWLKSLGYTETLIEHPQHEWHYFYE